MRDANAKQGMFQGVARSHLWRDAAVVTIWVALAGAFLAEVTPAARPVRETGPDVVATSQAPQARRHPSNSAPEPLTTDYRFSNVDEHGFSTQD